MGRWNEAKIKEFAEVKGGKRLPKGKKLVKEPNTHPYIKIKDFNLEFLIVDLHLINCLLNYLKLLFFQL